MSCGAHDKPKMVEVGQLSGLGKDMDVFSKELGDFPLKILSRAIHELLNGTIDTWTFVILT